MNRFQLAQIAYDYMEDDRYENSEPPCEHETMLLCDEDGDGGEWIEPKTNRLMQDFACAECGHLEDRFTGRFAQ